MSHFRISSLDWSPADRPRAARALLSRVALEARPGEFVGLIGPNGSGKTSLLRCAFRYERPRTGAIEIGGEDVWTLSPRRAAQRIAVVLQDPPDEFGLTVGQVVAMGRTPHKRMLEGETAEDLVRIERALSDVGLAGTEARAFATLSGGERQRALLARALVQAPELLMLDEPTNHLDARHQIALLALVKRLRITTLATIHDLNLAAAFCDRLFVLADGEIVASGTPDEVLTTELLRAVYGVEAIVDRHPGGAYPRITLIIDEA
ncbi:ABC transporter ATP-binding protein [Burkholderia gladioli]|uniref:ABC transporter ATP-binding protein n=1 Tax=Burkholderia gladioli TaxID=28095 RepID=UPI003F7AE95E